MKKHLSLLFVLLISACSGSTSSVLSSNEESISSSASEVSSSEVTISESTSEKQSSITSSSEMSSSISSSSYVSSSISSSISSSSSSSSSSSQAPSSKESFDAFHERLLTKQLVLEDENYIKQVLYGDTVLDNHYYGKFAAQPDDGYMVIGDQGLFHYEVVNEEVVVDNCKCIDPQITICDYFMTAYDLKDLKDLWKEDKKAPYTFYSESSVVGDLIAELDGQGLLSYAATSYYNELVVAPDGMSAKYYSTIETDDFGWFSLEFEVSYSVDEVPTRATDFLSSHSEGLTSLNDFPSDVKEAIKNVTGLDINGPSNASYAHEAYYSDTIVVYEDYLVGNKVSEYRDYISGLGFTLSDITTESEDLKTLGYARYYYEKLTADLEYIIFVEIYHVPNVQLDDSVKSFYPNGIFHLRFIKQPLEQ